MMSYPTEVYGKFLLDFNKDKLSPIVLEQLKIKNAGSVKCLDLLVYSNNIKYFNIL